MRATRIATAFAAVLALIAAAAGAAWFARAPLAGWTVERVFALRGVPATVRFARFDPTTLTIDELRIGPPEAPAIAAAMVEAGYRPMDALRGRFDWVRARGLELRARWDGEGVRLQGLPATGGSGDAPVIAAPSLDVPAARVLLDTPIGLFAGDVTVSGGPGAGWRALAEFAPEERLDMPVRVDLRRAAADVEITDGAANGLINLELADLAADPVSAESASIDAAFEGRFDDLESFTGLTGAGAVTARLQSAVVEAEAARSLAERWIAPPPSGVAPLLGPHAEALRAALTSAAGGFDVDLAVDVEADGDQLVWRARRSATAASDSGVRLSLASADGGPATMVAALDTGAVSARDLALRVRGGGGPALRVDLDTLAVQPGERGPAVELAGAIAMDRWAADGLAAELDRTAVRLVGEGAEWRFEAAGGARALSARSGWQARELDARFDLVGETSAGGLTLRPRDGGVQRVTAAEFAVGAIAARNARVTLASVAPDPLVAIGRDGVRAAAQLSDLSAETSLAGPEWRMSAPAGELRVDPDGSGLTVRARVQAPRATGAARADDVYALRADLLSGEARIGEQLALGARVEGMRAGGDGLPVQFDRVAAEVDVTLDGERIASGRAALAGAEMRDGEALARFAPLAVAGSSRIVDGRISGEVTASLLAGEDVARGAFSHDLGASTGEASAETIRLEFAPGDLQPYDVVPFLRGALANASGAARALAVASWSAGELDAEGVVELDGLDFDTAAGRVEGLRSSVVMSDLVRGVTDGPQRVSLARLDMGVALEGGEAEFRLLDGWRVQVDRARFPFADGELALEPALWTLGAPEPRATILVSDINLAEVIGLFQPPDLVITGRVSGSAPVVARDRTVFVEGGQLSSLANGRIAYTGAAADAAANADPNAK
ncbi:MAG: YdbH domain-containing protein, partial [Caulobacterales bacterium]|nr:YdbH domain-containing protein [Caulobacterales bacterium]